MFKKLMDSQTFWRIAGLVTFVGLVLAITNTKDTNLSWIASIPGILFIVSAGGMGYADGLHRLTQDKS